MAKTYVHPFDSCTQDWFAVASILENLLLTIKAHYPSVKCVHLRSDEAGCYHNNLLLASIHDVSKRVGIAVETYYFSEPQHGKDICDRIICPMKLSVRKYCDGGHDIQSVKDTRGALLERPVKGITVVVGVVIEGHKTNILACTTTLSFYRKESVFRKHIPLVQGKLSTLAISSVHRRFLHRWKLRTGRTFLRLMSPEVRRINSQPKLTLQNCFPVLRKAALKALKGLTRYNVILIVVSMEMKYAKSPFMISCVVTGQHGFLPFSPKIIQGPNHLLHPRRMLLPFQWAGPCKNQDLGE